MGHSVVVTWSAHGRRDEDDLPLPLGEHLGESMLSPYDTLRAMHPEHQPGYVHNHRARALHPF